MNTLYKKKIEAFLALKNVAVLGYSTSANQPANAIYKKLESNGYTVFAVNPRAEQITEVPCYPDVASISKQVEGAVLCTPPAATEQAVRECHQRGINHIWIHQGIGPGSFSEQAFQTAKQLGVTIIPGACPMMFVKPDIFHRCAGWFKKLPE